MPPSASGAARPPGQRAGFIAAVSAYFMWGMLPAYFQALAPAGPVEIVAWRIIFSLLFCVILITALRGWRAFIAVARRPRLMFIMGVAGMIIVLNWQLYVYATLNGQVIETSLGYFINPVVTVLLGVLVLHEKLRPAQWLSIGVSVVAILVLAFNYGVFPWLSLLLGVTFGLYGLIKKRVGNTVDAVTGFTIETAWLLPVAIGQLIFVGATSGVVLGTAGPVNTMLLVAAGVISAIPLLLFATAARRLPLVYLGLIQYLAPLLQFLFGVFIMLEPMPFERWMGFGLVWLALIILTIDMLLHGRAMRRALPLPG